MAYKNEVFRLLIKSLTAPLQVELTVVISWVAEIFRPLPLSVQKRFSNFSRFMYSGLLLSSHGTTKKTTCILSASGGCCQPA